MDKDLHVQQYKLNKISGKYSLKRVTLKQLDSLPFNSLDLNSWIRDSLLTCSNFIVSADAKLQLSVQLLNSRIRFANTTVSHWVMSPCVKANSQQPNWLSLEKHRVFLKE